MNPYAFLSYQTSDKVTAGRIKEVLAEAGIDTFLAHEDIKVSDEWRLKILEEIGKANIFICLVSAKYLKSPWCVQESGIAAFRSEMAIVPLSIDGKKPTGFVSSFQAVKADPSKISIRDLIPAFLIHDFDSGIKMITDLIGRSVGWRSAEDNFKLILSHIPKMSNDQIKLLLQRSAENPEVHHATLCARKYLPPLLKSHGKYLSPKTRLFLKDICKQYAPVG